MTVLGSIARIHRAVDAASGLRPEDVANVEEFIEAGELLLAFETLCTQIYEWEISMPRSIVADLERLGQEFDADPLYAAHLWEDARDD